MEENKIPEAPITSHPEMSPDLVHTNIMRCYKLGNRIHRKLLGWVLVLIERNHCVALGSPLPVFYVKLHLGCEKTEAYDIIKTAKALPCVPRSADAFEAGDISWAKLKQIARVATEETEKDWLDFARSHKPGELKAQVRDALKTNRKAPRKDGRGLSNLQVNMVIPMSLEVQEIVRKALQKATDVMREVLAEFSREEGREPTLEEVVRFLSEKVLATDLLGLVKDQSERERAIYDLLIHQCSDCKARLLHTEDGPIAISHKDGDEIERKARKVVINHEDLVKGEALPVGEVNDQQIPKGIELKRLALDRHCCARCGTHLNLHLHHVIFRSKRGPNEVWNLLTVCERDHACIHGGTLEVFLVSQGKVIWHSRADKIDRFLKDELKEYASIPAVNVTIAARAPEAPSPQSPAAAEAAPARVLSRVEEGAIAALVKVTKQSRTEARERVLKALQMLSSLGRAATADEIFATAYYGRVIENGGKVRRCGNGKPVADAGGNSARNGDSKAPEASKNPEDGDTK
jgi:hypothetical protein